MRAPSSSASPRHRLLLRGSLALTVATAVAAAVTAATSAAREATGPAVPQDRPGPVLLVPGYGGSTEALGVLGARLAAAGREVALVPLPGGGTGDLEATADALAAAVAQAVASGAPSVDVVGYSAGGVTARLYAAREGAVPVRRVVTLGSPHHGTGVAALATVFAPRACTAACAQLVPGSPLLDRLNDGDETPDGPRWVSVWTTGDEVVTPPESARLAGATQVALQDVCADAVVAHGDLPRDPLPVGIVLTALGVEEPVTPAPDDCAALRRLGQG